MEWKEYVACTYLCKNPIFNIQKIINECTVEL